jgi:zinc D-Ala-D-Ala carboxypeptidase
MSRMLSKNLTYDRAVYSGNAQIHGIPNTPNDQELKALILWGEKIYDPICEKFGKVFTSSVFRDDTLQKDKWGKMVSVNGLAGGSKTSGHVKGECGDLDGDAPNTTWASLDNNVLFKWIRQNLVYDQLIAEYELNGRPKWIHVGYRAIGNRQQTLIAAKNTAGNTVYMRYSDALYKKIYKGSRDVGDILNLEGFIVPEFDYQTSLDETYDDGYEQEVKLSREFNEFIEVVSEAQEEDLPVKENTPNAKVENGVTTIEFDIEGTVITFTVKIEK